MSITVGARAQAPPAGSPPKLTSVPNATIDLLDPSALPGPPPMSSVTGESVPSLLGVDYFVIQRAGPLDDAWRDSLAAAGGETLQVYPIDGFLVRAAPGWSPSPAQLPDVRALVPYLPAYKISWQFGSMLDGQPFDELVEDSLVTLSAALHRGEDAADYEAALSASLSSLGCVVQPTSTHPVFLGGVQTGQILTVRVEPACARKACETMAKMEAVEYVGALKRSVPLLDESTWFTQTGLSPASPSFPIPPGDTSTYHFDLTAKCFANGLTGRGQIGHVIDQSPLGNRSCKFRYGPNAADIALPVSVPFGGPPGEPVEPNLDRKIVAIYEYTGGWNPPCCPGELHVGAVADAYAGDDFAVLAARHGREEDDPTDDELVEPDFAVGIDHHQRADGMAPGAQFVVHELNTEPALDHPPTWEDWLDQGYRTRARVTAMTASAGSYYQDDAPRVDSLLWHRRELVLSGAIGNSGSRPNLSPPEFGLPGAIETISAFASAKNSLAVGATRRGSAATQGLMYQLGTPPITQLNRISSHGPAWKDRLTPRVVVPGELIEAAHPVGQRFDGTGDPRPDDCQDLILFSGTSIASPAAAGLATLVRQYFADGYYPGGALNARDRLEPTSALAIGTIINATRNLVGDYTADDGLGGARGDRPTHGQGWGVVTLDDTLFFAGDPAPWQQPGERSRMVVLDDIPNGLTVLQLDGIAGNGELSDGREDVVDALHPALSSRAGVVNPVNEYEIWIDRSEEVHLTLAWTDPPSSPSSSPTGPNVCSQVQGIDPLRNDLDLELIGPVSPTEEKVFRTRVGSTIQQGLPCPSSATGDVDRQWENGFSKLATVGSSARSNCLAGNWLDQDMAQFSTPPFCDFRTRDSSNNVENIFLPADPALGVQRYLARVMGFSLEGVGAWPCYAGDPYPNCVATCMGVRDESGNPRTGLKVTPNYVSGDVAPDPDGVERFDCITDRDQGYALVASGKIATAHAAINFSRARYRCGDAAFIQLAESDLAAGSTPVVTVTTSAGDCESFALHPVLGGVFWESDPFPVLDGTDAPPNDCSASDGVVVALDDGDLLATYVETLAGGGTRTRTATARMSCRDLVVSPSIESLTTCGRGAVLPPTLRPDEVAELVVKIDAAAGSGHAMTGVWAAVIPERDDIVMLSGGGVLGNIDPTGPGSGVNLHVRVFVPSTVPCWPEDTSLRFRIELHGEHGFFDRGYVDVPFECTPLGTDTTADIPGEVPDRDAAGVTAVRVTRPETTFGSGIFDIRITWDDAVGADRYQIYRGTIRALADGRYDHSVPPGEESTLCNNPDVPPPMARLLIQEGNALGDSNSPPLFGARYYLIGAVKDCAGASVVGSLGRAQPRPLTDPAFGDRRPVGAVPVPGCTP